MNNNLDSKEDKTPRKATEARTEVESLFMKRRMDPRGSKISGLGNNPRLRHYAPIVIQIVILLGRFQAIYIRGFQSTLMCLAFSHPAFLSPVEWDPLFFFSAIALFPGILKARTGPTKSIVLHKPGEFAVFFSSFELGIE